MIAGNASNEVKAKCNAALKHFAGPSTSYGEPIGRTLDLLEVSHCNGTKARTVCEIQITEGASTSRARTAKSTSSPAHSQTCAISLGYYTGDVQPTWWTCKLWIRARQSASSHDLLQMLRVCPSDPRALERELSKGRLPGNEPLMASCCIEVSLEHVPRIFTNHTSAEDRHSESFPHPSPLKVAYARLVRRFVLLSRW